ncbi:unnamed protein product [Penicillium manginii]
MPSILHLPYELLTCVLGQLSPFDLESVAKTFNKTLYSTSHRLLKPHARWMKNALRISALFPPFATHTNRRLLPSFPGHLEPLNEDWSSTREEMSVRDCRVLGLDLNCLPYIRSSPPDLRSWMKLDGTFGWLEPLGDRVLDDMRPYIGIEGRSPVAPGWQIDLLVKQAGELGLTLPEGFEVFLRSDRLHGHIPSYSAWYFSLSKLVKCPSEFDKGAGGYLVRFHCDQQFCAFSYLYLNPVGNHCVLGSATDIYQDMSTDEIEAPDASQQEQGRDQQDGDNYNDAGAGVEEVKDLAKLDFTLWGLTFEEYLAMTYFEELLSYGAKPFRGLKDYAKHIYRSPIEVEAMRTHIQTLQLNPFSKPEAGKRNKTTIGLMWPAKTMKSETASLTQAMMPLASQ